MKIKTSITLSEDVLQDLDALSKGFKNRSEAIENAILFFIEKRKEQAREKRDLQILNKLSDRLNAEAEDVLSYQEDV